MSIVIMMHTSYLTDIQSIMGEVKFRSDSHYRITVLPESANQIGRIL